jgi:hypothetical protein
MIALKKLKLNEILLSKINFPNLDKFPVVIWKYRPLNSDGDTVYDNPMTGFVLLYYFCV